MEFLWIVDKNDNPIGKATREEIHETNVWHRGIHVLLNSQDKILLQLRSPKQDKSPNRYDCSVSGHVNYGESYDEAMRREIKEELGIEANKIENLRKVIKFRMNYGRNDNMISVLYLGKYNKFPQNFNRDEIARLELLSIDEIKHMLYQSPEKFAKWTREIFKWYFGVASEIEVMERYC